MSRRMVGVLLLLTGAEALGVWSGHWFFGIFQRVVPAAVLTDFNRSTAHGYFLWRGLLLGIGLFLWTLLAVLTAPLFRRPSAGPAPPSRPE